jgi:hypothetical protein
MMSLKTVHYVVQDIENYLNDLDSLMNKKNASKEIDCIVSSTKEKGTYFKLSHFIVLIYRLSILTFHYNRSDEFLNEYKNANNIKKLLYFLRKLETSKGFLNLNWQENSYMLKNISFIPSDKVLLDYVSEEDIAIMINQLGFDPREVSQFQISSNMFSL